MTKKDKDPDVGHVQIEEEKTLLEATANSHVTNGGQKLPSPSNDDAEIPVEDACAKSKSGSAQREVWSRKIDFLLACIGFSVGLGNVWRFPYLCYKNGGGAFLLPYFLCVAIGGIPMFYLEVALGQFMSVGGIGAWKICPLMQGTGLASTVIVSLLNIYYNVILAWAFYYLFSSFTSVLPWSHCNSDWNTENCSTSVRTQPHGNLSGIGNLSLEYSSIPTNGSSNWTSDRLGDIRDSPDHYVDPVTEFWEKRVLQISDGIDSIGPPKWDLALCLLLAWVVVYLCICKGIKSSGKVTRRTECCTEKKINMLE